MILATLCLPLAAIALLCAMQLLEEWALHDSSPSPPRLPSLLQGAGPAPRSGVNVDGQVRR